MSLSDFVSRWVRKLLANKVATTILVILSFTGIVWSLFGIGLLIGYLTPGGFFVSGCYIEDNKLTLGTFLSCCLSGISIAVIIAFGSFGLFGLYHIVLCINSNFRQPPADPSFSEVEMENTELEP